MGWGVGSTSGSNCIRLYFIYFTDHIIDVCRNTVQRMRNEECDEWMAYSLRWRYNDHAGVSNHQPHGCLLNRLFRRNSKKTSKLRVTGLCAGNSPGTGEFPAQMASYPENVSIWWRHHVMLVSHCGSTIYLNINFLSWTVCLNRISTFNECCWTWWSHQMERLSALLALYVGIYPVTGEFPS